jgi:3-hydroxyisobutyrate dehydrogenase
MKIAFIGLGAMGRPIASNLLCSGHQLRVFDTDPAASASFADEGAVRARSPADAVLDVTTVFTCLPGPREVEDTAQREDGLLSALSPGSVWFDLTTNAPDSIRTLHRRCAERGIVLMDAPVSGGPSGAASKKLAFWVGGDQEVYRRFEPLLRQMADSPRYVGEIGSGNVVKLVHNSASFAAQLLFAEAFTLGVKSGVDPLVLFDALRDGTTGRSRTFDRLREQFLPGIYDPPAFRLRLACKDMHLALDLAKLANVPMRMTELAARDMEEAIRRGWSERDARIAMILQEERAGVSVKVDVGGSNKFRDD